MFGTDKTKAGILVGSLLILAVIIIVVIVMRKESFDTIQKEEPMNTGLRAKNVQFTSASEKPF